MSFIEVLDRLDAIAGYLQTDANERLGVHNLLHVQDQKANGTSGGSFAHGAWRTRVLNTVVLNNISGSSLASNVVTLPAGKYFVEGRCLAYKVNSNRSRIIDTASNQSVVSMNDHSYSADFIFTRAYVSGVLESQNQLTIELQHICSATHADGFGAAGDAADNGPEIYADLKIWKLS
jgi:hypothetical protein